MKRWLPEKAAASRRLVYLDQNIISNLAKRRLNRTVGPVYHDLDEALTEAVHIRENVRCVESLFHRWESSGLLPDGQEDGPLFNAIGDLVQLLSWRLCLRVRSEVVGFALQAEAALRRHGFEYPAGRRWRGGFRSDPDESNDRAGVRVGGDLFMLGIKWTPWPNPTPSGWAAQMESHRAAGTLSLRDDVSSILRSEVRSWCAREAPRWASGWAASWDPMALDEDDIRPLVEGDDLLAVPFVDVYCDLLSSVLVEPNRAFKDSDWADVEILSLAIPYCHLVVTDSYMAEKCNQLRLGERYDTRILSTRRSGLEQVCEVLAETSGAAGE